MVNAQDIFRVLIKSDRTSHTKVIHCPRLAWWVFWLCLLGYRHPFMPLYSENIFVFSQLIRTSVSPTVFSSVACHAQFSSGLPSKTTVWEQQNIALSLITWTGVINFWHWQFHQVLLVPCSGSGMLEWSGSATLTPFFTFLLWWVFSRPGRAFATLQKRRTSKISAQLWAGEWHLAQCRWFQKCVTENVSALASCLLTDRERRSGPQKNQSTE